MCLIVGIDLFNVSLALSRGLRIGFSCIVQWKFFVNTVDSFVLTVNANHWQVMIALRYLYVVQKDSVAGNRTPVSRVTGGNTGHYTTTDVILCS